MPALPPVPAVIKFKAIWTRGADQDVQTHHYVHYTGGPPSVTDMNSLVSGYGTAIVAHFLASTDTLTVITETTGEDLSSASGAVSSVAIGSPGTNPNPPNAGSIGVNVQTLISRRYRGGKPRTDWPCGTASDLTTPQSWKGAFVSGFTTLHAAFASAVLGLSAGTTVLDHFVNVSYFQGFTVVTNPITGRSRNVPKLRVGGPVVDTSAAFVVHGPVGHVRRRG